MNVQDQEIEIVDINYIYEFINERECKKITKIMMNVPSHVEKYTHIMNDMIHDLRITYKKGNELPVVDNKKPKEQYYQSNDVNENVK